MSEHSAILKILK